MDLWKYFDISHRDHVVCNPLSVQKLDELVDLVELSLGSRALDIGCGKAELLLRLAERYGVTGDGVDLSPYCVRDARAAAAARVPGSKLTFHHQDGRDFRTEVGPCDLAVCLGATWIFGGYRGTLDALWKFVRPGGFVIVGEPHWRQPPAGEYLAAAGLEATSFATHAGNVGTGADAGLSLEYTLVSNEDDWDRYEGLQWRAAERHAAANPDDPEALEVVRRQRAHRDLYLRWGRDALGWAVYVFRTPPEVLPTP